MIESGYVWRVRELADAARDVAEAATVDGERIYAKAVEDVLRVLVGDAPPEAELGRIFDHESLS